jgi:hypothetical protein
VLAEKIDSSTCKGPRDDNGCQRDADHCWRPAKAEEGGGEQHPRRRADHASTCVKHAPASKIYSQACVGHALVCDG